MKKKILFPILIIFLLINNCGFKIVNKSEIYKFDINEIIATGDNRINFKIKNKLIFSSEKNEKKLLDIYLYTKKSKEVNKEKATYLRHVAKQKVNGSGLFAFCVL